MKTLLIGLLTALVLTLGTAHAQTAVFQSFDGPTPPVNKEGQGYPKYYSSSTEGNAWTGSIDTVDKVSGTGSLKMTMSSGLGHLRADFNPYDGKGRDFARIYSQTPWQFNTYNKFRFWIKAPSQGRPHRTDGGQNCQLGLYNKRVTKPNSSSDEDGGNHYYMEFQTPNVGAWTQVILNWHPNHVRGQNQFDPGLKQYPTSGDPAKTYNYWDALSRFYIDCAGTSPGVWHLDQMEFYKEPNAENEVSVSALTGTYLASKNRVIVTWSRQRTEDSVLVDIKYSFTSIHSIGWNNATAAPGSPVSPGGDMDYIGMVWDTTAINLSGQSTLYVGIMPRNTKTLFSQIAIPLTGGGTPPPPPVTLPAAPTGLQLQ